MFNSGHVSYKKYLALDKKEDHYETMVGRYKFRTENYKASMSYSKNIGKDIADLSEEVRDFLVAVDELIEVSKVTEQLIMAFNLPLWGAILHLIQSKLKIVLKNVPTYFVTLYIKHSTLMGLFM